MSPPTGFCSITHPRIPPTNTKIGERCSLVMKHKGLSGERAARHRADDSDPRGLRRLRGDLEGPDPAAHPLDVGHERDPRDRDRRRDHRHGRAPPGLLHAARLVRGGDPRDRERRRRLRRHRPDARDVQEAARRRRVVSPSTANLLYLITIAAFILALRFLSSPRHARLGVQIGAAGMLWAVLVTFFKDEVVTGWWWTAAGIAIGSV